MRAARLKPALASRAFTVSITVARFTDTVLPLTLIVSLPSPVSTATNWVCASRLAWIQACSNSGLLTNREMRSVTKLRTPLASGVASALRLVATCGGRP